MEFGAIQKRRFGADNGAYSVVTGREDYDSQITLADYEAAMVVSHYGKENIHIGNVKSDKARSSKKFRLYPSGEIINLNVVYPKPHKTELRLYISASAGFKPVGDDIWFMFIKDGDIWIGSMAESAWRSESSELKVDEFDEIYQNSVNDNNDIRIAKLKERDTYARDRNIALKRMMLAGFICEFNPNHKLFTSRFSKKPYLEVHHLIPMGIQGVFSKPLDTLHNVFCLCPYCHRAVHHAEEPLARKILSGLAARRPVLEEFSINIPELYSFYAVEVID